jgi:hypothetical protein
MAETQLALTAEERNFLVDLLETTVKQTRVEEHRTRTPTYRENILKQERLMSSLLNKLGVRTEPAAGPGGQTK